MVRLAAWLCRNLPDPTITHASKQAFVASWLAQLLSRNDFSLGRANQQKFQLRNLIEAQVRSLKGEAIARTFQRKLFGDERASNVAVNHSISFTYNPQAYAPTKDYDGRFGAFAFRKHYYGRIGDFDTKEEFECACWLDTQAQKGRMLYWVRNLVRREGCSFFLQKADGRFYPDFICQLPGSEKQQGTVLAVEYKGSHLWTGAEDDRLIGGLWTELSAGRCCFVMVTNKNWDVIEKYL